MGLFLWYFQIISTAGDFQSIRNIFQFLKRHVGVFLSLQREAEKNVIPLKQLLASLNLATVLLHLGFFLRINLPHTKNQNVKLFCLDPLQNGDKKKNATDYLTIKTRRKSIFINTLTLLCKRA